MRRSILPYLIFCIFPFFGNSQQTPFDWTKKFSGTGDGAQILDIETDWDNNYLITGSFYENLDVEGYHFESMGIGDAFFAKLTPNGKLIWIKHFPGSSEQDVYVEVDSLNNYYVVGFFLNDVNIEGTLLNINGGGTFISKFNSSGNLQWLKLLGPTVQVHGFSGFRTNNSGDFILAGTYLGEIDFGGEILTNSTDTFNDIFVASYNSLGELQWIKAPQGHIASLDIPGNMIAANHIDSKGNAYISGTFVGNLELDQYSLTSKPGNFGLFISKILNDGSYEKPITGQMGSFGQTNGRLPYFGGADTDTKGNFYVSINFYDSLQILDFSLVENLRDRTTTQFLGDVAILKFNKEFELAWAESIGGPDPDYGILEVATDDGVILSGFTYGGLLPVSCLGAGLYGLRIDSLGEVTFATNIGKTWEGTFNTSTIDHTNKILIGGIIGTLIDFDPDNNLQSTFGSGFLGRYEMVPLAMEDGELKSDKFICLLEDKLKFDCKEVDFATAYQWEILSVGTRKVFDTNKSALILPIDSIADISDISVRVRGKNNCQLGGFSSFKNFEVRLGIENPFIPNVITPNQDQYNDTLKLPSELEGSELIILNRWGHQIYKTSSYTNNWGDDSLSAGIYYYLINNACLGTPLKGAFYISY